VPVHKQKAKMPGFPIVLSGGLQVEPAPDVWDPRKPGESPALQRQRRPLRKAAATKTRDEQWRKHWGKNTGLKTRHYETENARGVMAARSQLKQKRCCRWRLR